MATTSRGVSTGPTDAVRMLAVFLVRFGAGIGAGANVGRRGNGRADEIQAGAGTTAARDCSWAGARRAKSAAARGGAGATGRAAGAGAAAGAAGAKSSSSELAAMRRRRALGLTRSWTGGTAPPLSSRPAL